TLAFDSHSNLVLAVNTANPTTTKLANVANIVLDKSSSVYGIACALMTGGTLDCWGNNSQGELGNGTTDFSPFPAPVPGLSGVTIVAVGNPTCALLSGGTVECWGDNSSGELGIGTTTGPDTCANNLPCSKTPVPVAGLTGATAISAGVTYACA